MQGPLWRNGINHRVGDFITPVSIYVQINISRSTSVTSSEWPQSYEIQPRA